MRKLPKIVVHKPGAHGWKYTFVAPNGVELATSVQTYGRKRDAIRGAKLLIKTCVMMFERFKDTRHGPKIKAED